MGKDLSHGRHIYLRGCLAGFCFWLCVEATMIATAPRASTLFAMRESRIGARHFGSLRTNTPKGVTQTPAYSIDSEILCAGFDDNEGLEGTMFSRRKPDVDTGAYSDSKKNYVLDGKDATSLKVQGGAAWCP